jgi:hypothetical protein
MQESAPEMPKTAISHNHAIDDLRFKESTEIYGVPFSPSLNIGAFTTDNQ